MRRIQRLDENLAAQIAAGEVIESPAAIIKELVENSLDAGAREIDIRILGDGFEEIQVRDDGCGILADDLPLALESFATSKIASIEELIAARTMGFRGEALGAIAAVSRLAIESREQNAQFGAAIFADESGRRTEASPIARGTRVVVRDLFYNIPVRREYYQNTLKIRRQLAETLTQLASANPQLALRYQLGDAEPVVLPAREALIERLADLWGNKIETDLLPVYYEVDSMTLEGYLSKFYFYRTHASDIRFWINRRAVQYKPLVGLLRHAYGELMPKGRFPFAALFLNMPAHAVDANVHPQKREVRFKHELAVQNFLREALVRTIGAEGGIAAGSMVRTVALGKTGYDTTVPDSNAANATQAPGAKVESMPSTLFGAVRMDIRGAEAAYAVFPENLVLHTRLFNTFIIASGLDGLYLIDQHTAHERINYERFRALLEKKSGVSQKLAHALPIPLASFDHERLSVSESLLVSLGFEWNALGKAGYTLQAVPVYVEPGEEIAALETALRALEANNPKGVTDLFDQLAKDLSCRHAIRKGESASLADFRELLATLKRCEMPLRCPHGRPTIVRIDEKEIFAYFKRQV